MPRPYSTATPTAATTTHHEPEARLVTGSDGSTIATGALAMVQLAAGSGHVGGTS